MDVAAYMEKYGWKPGMGLGKDNSGRAEHIRVSKKANKRGIGMDSAKSFEPWWEKLYNKTAQQSINDSKKKKEGDETPASTEEPQKKEPQKSVGQLRVLGARLAPMFVRGSTLDLSKTQDTEAKSSSSSSDSDSDSDSSDDELVRPISTSNDTFEALGRRTGKKYSAAGKLSRLEAQEKKWNLIRSNSVSPASLLSNSTSPAPQVSNSTSPAPVEVNEKKRKRDEEEDVNKDVDDKEKKETAESETIGEPEKKKKKKHHHKEEEIIVDGNDECKEEKKKKKKHHHHHHHKEEEEKEEEELKQDTMITDNDECKEEKKKKKKKEKKENKEKRE